MKEKGEGEKFFEICTQKKITDGKRGAPKGVYKFTDEEDFSVIQSRKYQRMVNALAPADDEGRAKLR